MMKTIAVIGAGQLGSRHLQALSYLSSEYLIEVVDPSEVSLKTAQQRYEQVKNNGPVKEVKYFSKIDQLSSFIDIVIVASSSKIRRVIIEELLAKKEVGYLVLEKVLFTKLGDYDKVVELLKEKKIKTWVNCPRRMQEFYKKIKKKIHVPVEMTVVGNGWGLGCNGVHFIDLYYYLSGASEIVYSTKSLKREIYKSKREGYIEFNGVLTAETVEGGKFALNCYSQGISPISILIATQTSRVFITEGNNTIVRSSYASDNFEWKEESYDFKYQSQLSHIFVNSLIEFGTCELTPFNESVEIHKGFLESLIDVQSEIEGAPVLECQIT